MPLLGIEKGWSAQESMQAAQCAFTLLTSQVNAGTFEQAICFNGYSEEQMRKMLAEKPPEIPSNVIETIKNKITLICRGNYQYGIQAAIAQIISRQGGTHTLASSFGVSSSTAVAVSASAVPREEQAVLPVIQGATQRTIAQPAFFAALYQNLNALMAEKLSRPILEFRGYDGEILTLSRMDDGAIKIKAEIQGADYRGEKLRLLGFTGRNQYGATPSPSCYVLTVRPEGRMTYYYQDVGEESFPLDQISQAHRQNQADSLCQLFAAHFKAGTFNKSGKQPLEGLAELCAEITKAVEEQVTVLPSNQQHIYHNFLLLSQDSQYEIAVADLPLASRAKRGWETGRVLMMEKKFYGGQERGARSTTGERGIVLCYGIMKNGDRHIDIVLRKSDDTYYAFEASENAEKTSTIRLIMDEHSKIKSSTYRAISEHSYTDPLIFCFTSHHTQVLGTDDSSHDARYPKLFNDCEYVLGALSSTRAMLLSPATVVDGCYRTDGTVLSDRDFAETFAIRQGPVQTEAFWGGVTEDNDSHTLLRNVFRTMLYQVASQRNPLSDYSRLYFVVQTLHLEWLQGNALMTSVISSSATSAPPAATTASTSILASATAMFQTVFRHASVPIPSHDKLLKMQARSRFSIVDMKIEAAFDKGPTVVKLSGEVTVPGKPSRPQCVYIKTDEQDSIFFTNLRVFGEGGLHNITDNPNALTVTQKSLIAFIKENRNDIVLAFAAKDAGKPLSPTA